MGVVSWKLTPQEHEGLANIFAKSPPPHENNHFYSMGHWLAAIDCSAFDDLQADICPEDHPLPRTVVVVKVYRRGIVQTLLDKRPVTMVTGIHHLQVSSIGKQQVGITCQIT